MTRRHFSPAQIAEALQALYAGVKLPEVCRRFGIAELTMRRWQQKSGLLQPPVDPVVSVALSLEQAANRIAGLERRLEAFRLVLVTMLEPAQLEEAAQILEVSLSSSSRRARQLLGLPSPRNQVRVTEAVDGKAPRPSRSGCSSEGPMTREAR